jgi:ABC-type nickel/cobalt efflux system permease component RcnA
MMTAELSEHCIQACVVDVIFKIANNRGSYSLPETDPFAGDADKMSDGQFAFYYCRTHVSDHLPILVDIEVAPMSSGQQFGLAFGFGWTPCIGPILGAILTASAASATVSEGVALLAVYSAGLGIPFLIAAAFTDRLTRRLRTIGRIGRRLHQLAGGVMVAMGIAMMTGHLSAFAYWLLDTFPLLGRIG